MSDNPDSPGSGDEEMWSEVDEAYPDGDRPGRHDGFTPKRRRVFLKTLRKTGCVQDGCRRAGISDTAAYNLRERDPLFARLWDAAVAAAGADLQLLAFHYATEGEEEEVWAYGKLVGTRRRRDAHLFRMLLQGSNPGKYGGNGLGARKRLEKKIRRELEEQRKAAEEVDIEEVRERIARRIQRLRERMLREGHHVDEDGRLIPPGYVRASAAPPADQAAAAPEAARTPEAAPADPDVPSDDDSRYRCWR